MSPRYCLLPRRQAAAYLQPQNRKVRQPSRDEPLPEPRIPKSLRDAGLIRCLKGSALGFRKVPQAAGGNDGAESQNFRYGIREMKHIKKWAVPQHIKGIERNTYFLRQTLSDALIENHGGSSSVVCVYLLCFYEATPFFCLEATPFFCPPFSASIS